MKLGTKVGLGHVHIVLDGDPSPSPPKGHNPQFSAHICCGQMAGWISMPLSMQVGLGPSDIVLDGDPAPLPNKGTEPPPIFGPCLLWPRSPISPTAELLLIFGRSFVKRFDLCYLIVVCLSCNVGMR